MNVKVSVMLTQINWNKNLQKNIRTQNYTCTPLNSSLITGVYTHRSEVNLKCYMKLFPFLLILL